MEASAFAVIAYGYVAAAVCVLIGPIFIPWFIVPKMDWLFWGWLKASIGRRTRRHAPCSSRASPHPAAG